MLVSDAGVRLIAEFEGFSARLYDDPAGNCTVGYGFLVHLGPCDGRASEASYVAPLLPAQGLVMLREKVAEYAAFVARLATVALTQPQFDALTSFCYNVGCGGFERSTVRVAVNTGDDVCRELRGYVRGTDGVVYPGLVRRRRAECAMYMSGGDYLSAEQYEELRAADARNASDLRDVLRFTAAAFRELARSDVDLKSALAAIAGELDRRVEALERAAR